MDKIKVLVVDDEPVYADIIKKTLNSSKYQVLKNFDAGSGIKSAREKSPDIILLDWNLPDMDGVEACRILKETKETKNIPVLMLTSMTATKSKVTGLDAGADDYITKPFDEKELAARINAAFRRFKSGKEEIEENIKSIEKYISKELSGKLRGTPGEGQYEETVSILFCDLCGFTVLTRKLEPEKIKVILNKYFSLISESIQKKEGVIDKFIGDAVMALFRSRRENEGLTEEKAVESAIEIHRSISRLKGPGGIPLKVRTGIHTGQVIIGSVGTEKRSDFTVIGSAVNFAAKLQQTALPGQILVSREAAEALKGVYNFKKIDCRDLNEKYGLVPYEVQFET